jgi:hypothetical protein
VDQLGLAPVNWLNGFQKDRKANADGFINDIA